MIIPSNVRVNEDGDIFQSSCQAVVNPVNCQGVMGKGLAKEFKHRYPEYFLSYKAVCNIDPLSDTPKLRLGGIHFYPLPKGQEFDYIFSFPTKDHWTDKSELSSIIIGLKTLEDLVTTWGITSIAIPALGCGLGGLNWEEEVLPLLMSYVEGHPHIKFEIYSPK